jgi:hypothetical protein
MSRFLRFMETEAEADRRAVRTRRINLFTRVGREAVAPETKPAEDDPAQPISRPACPEVRAPSGR